MKELDANKYHQLYGERRTRTVYFKTDFLDYVIMLLFTGAALAVTYGPSHVLTMSGLALCLFSLVSFMIRHGVELKIPLILRQPVDIVYMLVYKIKNMTPVYFIGLAILVAENFFIYFTPSLPHHTELMRTIALYLFYLHLIAITLYRTISLFSHLAKREMVREYLMQTPWKRIINEKTNMNLEIFHAYFTGLLTHIVLIAPWYFVLTHVNYSLVFLPVALVVNFIIQAKGLAAYIGWFYRDHWLGHNSEFEFVYLHGSHHDAIPSGLIGVSGNGYLEGFMRGTVGAATPFFNPVIASLIYTLDVKGDIDLHQFIPAVFPKIDLDVIKLHQHSMHHLGRLEPYSFGGKFNLPSAPERLKKKFKRFPDEVLNSIRYDEELNGFKWDNPMFRKTIELIEKYNGK